MERWHVANEEILVVNQITLHCDYDYGRVRVCKVGLSHTA